jgi:(R,R)-butanediol dehydrogenase/meso-butanediol dehydrogenase/diacetyl reductase
MGASVGLHADGAFAPLIAVPAYTLFAVPDAVPDTSAAIVEPLAVGLHALRQVRMSGGDSVVVMGMGMIGAAVLLLANALGAGQVIVVEPSPVRRQLADRLGAHKSVDPREADVRALVRAHTGGRGADVVLDCTGRPDTPATSIELARRGGRIGLCGIPHEPSQVRADRLVYFERELIGCLGYRYDHDAVLRLLSSRRLDVRELIGEAIGIDQLESAFERMSSDPAVALRIPIHMTW